MVGRLGMLNAHFHFPRKTPRLSEGLLSFSFEHMKNYFPFLLIFLPFSPISRNIIAHRGKNKEPKFGKIYEEGKNHYHQTKVMMHVLYVTK